MGYTAVLVLPILVAIAAGVYYLYTEITRLMSKSAVRNKVVVITDAVSGMGKECSRVFHTGGARVILCGKSWEKLEALYDTLSSAADPSVTFTPKLVVLDFSDIDAIPEVTREILECYGCVDVLISNASMKVKAPVQNVSLELDKRIMDTNYFGPIILTKDAASKHAAQAFFDCLRAEVEEFGISVSTVSPTFIRSYHQQPQPHNTEKCIWKFFFRKFAHGVHPEEVADEVLRTVNRKKKEVVMANPIARAALYIRSFLPGLFFAVVAAGVKDVPLVEEDTQ
ncbi:Dehydrogenase/reductase SDR family member 7C [Acipenser ruthenus]|uniref:Dehydrogenase/reductase SDR family member 7C n=1 Tax=Acipenser ruthenus TaxID=7906 RepID=A0A444U8H5_ACIRT|nr:Dehydrogenase/reductase SDR family member 7C [Acipenser ruthenus]